MRNLFIIVLVFALLFLNGCNTITNAEPINDLAEIPASFNFSDRQQKVIGLFFDKNKQSIATLYGNDLAYESSCDSLDTHLAGEVYTMVTWDCIDNPQWFGGKIPGKLKEIEVLELVATRQGYSNSYKRYVGSNLVLDKNVKNGDGGFNSLIKERCTYLLNQKAAIFL